MNLAIIKSIEKENIKFLTFPKKEILPKTQEKIIRKMDLLRALALGNLQRNKVKIIFIDNEGLKKVETTIWGCTDKEVILKQGTIIPIERIHSVM